MTLSWQLVISGRNKMCHACQLPGEKVKQFSFKIIHHLVYLMPFSMRHFSSQKQQKKRNWLINTNCDM